MRRKTLQETLDRLLLLIRSGHPIILIRSHEEARVRRYLAKVYRKILASSPRKTLFRWDQGDGLQPAHALGPIDKQQRWLEIEGPEDLESVWKYGAAMQPDVLLKTMRTAGVADQLGNCLVLLFDIHPYLSQFAAPSLVRPLRNAAAAMRQIYYDNQNAGVLDFPYRTIVIVAPTSAEISPELQRELVVVDFPLPEQDELRKEVKKLVEDKQVLRLPPPTAKPKVGAGPDAEATSKAEAAPMVEAAESAEELYDRISGAGCGLTLDVFRLALNAFAVDGQPLTREHVPAILDLKADSISNAALHYTPPGIVKLGGLKPLKLWINHRKSLALYESKRVKYGLSPLRGIVLNGVSGGGKSMAAKLIASEFGLALLRLDVGALFGSYIGQSEGFAREALDLAMTLAPIVLWLDEVEKAFSGINDGGDSGVSARVFGIFLTWLAEKQDSVFVVATSNDFKRITDRFPEFGRKGRFDEIFWVHLPSPEARREIFRIHLGKYFGLEMERRLLPEFELGDLTTTAALAHGGPPEGDTSCERLADLLSRDHFSKDMTGAEIEYAVTESMHQLYGEFSRNDEKKFAAAAALETVVSTVRAAQNRCLYNDAGPLWAGVGQQLNEARNSGWVLAEQVP